jgi:hypothetical protein
MSNGISNAESSSLGRPMDKDTLEGFISVLDNWAAFFTLLVVIGVGGELVIHVMSSRANKKLIAFQKREALTQEAEIARMKKDSASFELDIAKANKGSADALERAAKLEKEAADAKLETEKLKQAVAWRTISQEAASQMEKILSAKPGSVNLRYTDGDPEALFLASQFSQILGNKAKWKIAPGAVKFANAMQFGIALPDADSTSANALREALSAAKIEYSTNPLPPTGAAFSISTIPGAPTLMIGSRRPPALQ